MEVVPLTRPAPARDRIVVAIVQGIENGALPPGQALDSEATLANRYTASRGTVRAALSQLADRGLIEPVPGAGWFVRDVGAQDGEGRQDRLAVVAQELRDLLQLPEWATPGTRFLSEKDLCEQYGLTRYGARAVLSTLEAQGLIVAVHGRGRFVAERT